MSESEQRQGAGGDMMALGRYGRNDNIGRKEGKGDGWLTWDELRIRHMVLRIYIHSEEMDVNNVKGGL